MRARLGLFDAFGIELEYMLVDRETLDVRPICDEVLRAAARAGPNEFPGDFAEDDGAITWSNELALHVVELKNSEPAPRLEALPALFQSSVERLDRVAASLGARLLPTAMHPWMDPARELALWPHEYGPVYRALDRAFDCRAHGWANVQSAQINLPFANDAEFARLSAAIRFLLPILPALAASSPIVAGRAADSHDARLEACRAGTARIPSMSGRAIPERAFTEADYRRDVLEPTWRALAPFDPEGLLRAEFANARGAIARFDRGAIEIRALDVQECPAADLAVAAAVVSAVRALVEERWCSFDEQARWDVEPLAELYFECAKHGDGAIVREREYLAAFGFPRAKCSAAELWQHLIGEMWIASAPTVEPWLECLGVILREGNLSRRILRAAGRDPTRHRLRELYLELSNCLVRGEPFRP
jgi:gamma-glutamyl:cysteine ligase YbdK (ATP-grasp superfamily)